MEGLPKEIIRFDTLRVEYGMAKHCQCKTASYEIDYQNRLVYCQSCGAIVDPFEALLNIAKYIVSQGAVVDGKVDAILLTGGVVRFQEIVDGIRNRCEWIAPISVYPGEMEQEALAYPVLRALRGEEEILAYSGRPVWNGFEGIDL